MEIKTFNVRFQEFGVDGEHFDNVVSTETEFEFGLNRKQDNHNEVFVGVSAFTKWTFESGSSAIMQCICGVFPSNILLSEMTFQDCLLVAEAGVGEINMKLPEYLQTIPFPIPHTLQIEDLKKESDKENLKKLFDQLKNHEGYNPITTMK